MTLYLSFQFPMYGVAASVAVAVLAAMYSSHYYGDDMVLACLTGITAGVAVGVAITPLIH